MELSPGQCRFLPGIGSIALSFRLAATQQTVCVNDTFCHALLKQRWSNIRLATRPESVTRDRRATYEG